jgi:hypothetical protein
MCKPVDKGCFPVAYTLPLSGIPGAAAGISLLIIITAGFILLPVSCFFTGCENPAVTGYMSPQEFTPLDKSQPFPPWFDIDNRGPRPAHFWGYRLPGPGVCLNELMASNRSSLVDDHARYPDWIELYNYSRETVFLKGYGLSDRPDLPLLWRFPDILLLPGDYLVVFASGQDNAAHENLYVHTNFRLNAENETLVLSDPTGHILDQMTISKHKPDVSYARKPDHPGEWGFCPGGTPGYKNDRDAYQQEKARKDPSPFSLSSSASRDLAPSRDKTIPLHHMPVLFLDTDPGNLWDPMTGILAPANREKTIEIPVHIDFFEPGGEAGFSLDAGMRLFGHSSRLLPQKPFYLITRKEYGNKTITYRIFPDKDTCIFRSILLRNGGEDGRYSRIRDSVTSTLARELGIDAQASRPVVVYINGEYWGQYFLRDKIDEYFLAYHHHLPSPAAIDLIEGNGNVKSGNSAAFEELNTFLLSHDPQDPVVYKQIQTMIDIDNLINYELSQIYFANTDMGNIRCWKERAPRGQWRWILFDTDWSFFSVQRDAFTHNLDPGGRGYKHYFSTLVITSLLKNETFKTQFIQQCLHLLETTFSPGHVCAVINRREEAIKDEIPAHSDRWGSSPREWERQVERLREFTRARPGYVRNHLLRYFHLDEGR